MKMIQLLLCLSSCVFSGKSDLVQRDIQAVVSAARVPVKVCGSMHSIQVDIIINLFARTFVQVILETSMLNDDQKRQACKLAQSAGAAFVKTSTGFGGGGVD
eukprot:SAG31_NODE_743_length_12418_cov_3.780908_10_plen_102_part_00